MVYIGTVTIKHLRAMYITIKVNAGDREFFTHDELTDSQYRDLVTAFTDEAESRVRDDYRSAEVTSEIDWNAVSMSSTEIETDLEDHEQDILDTIERVFEDSDAWYPDSIIAGV